jgi:hypothetical protein
MAAVSALGAIFIKQAAFETTFRATGGYLKAGKGLLKRATGRISRISK